jgi:hypothetical protein
MKTTRRSSLAFAAVFACALASGARAQEQQQRLERIPGMTEEKAKSLAQQEAAALEKRGLRDGMVLNKENAKLGEGLVPDEILNFYKSGDFYNTIVRFPAEKYSEGPDWDRASAENANNIDLDANNNLIDKRSGKDPGNLQGWPFPNIDPKDPKAPIKVYWNNQVKTWHGIGNSAFYLNITMLSRAGAERNLRVYTYQNHWIGSPPRLVPQQNPQSLLEESLTVVESPQDVYGTAQLGVRFRDDKQDLNWAYVPALRRVREVSPANRSDGFLGSDISQDDASFFDGKVTNFDFKLVGEGEMLCVADPVSLAGIYPKRMPSPQYPGGWRDFMAPDKGASGFMKADWKGVPWAPADQALVLRPVWIIDLVPKDRYYLYGKIQLAIDKLTWEGCYNRKWSWKGELLHDYIANHNLPLPQKNPDGTVDYFDAGLVIYRSGINFKLDRASNVNFPSDVWIDRNVKFPANWFDYQSLNRFGK